MIKVIATDMDGTFLDSKGLYDRDRFERVLTALEARGIKFVVASGNNMGRLGLMFDGFLDRISFVADNGAHVIDQGQELVRHTMPPELVKEFLNYIGDKQAAYCVSLSNESAVYLLEEAHLPIETFAIEKEQLDLFVSRIKRLKSFDDLPDEPVLKMGMLLPEAECDSILADFNANFPGNLTATTSGYGSVDVIETGLHKAWGLLQLLDKWGLTPDQVMAFGDGGNDVELLSFAGQSYAVDNAPDWVKASAKLIAPSHDEQGVLSVIEREILGQS